VTDHKIRARTHELAGDMRVLSAGQGATSTFALLAA
jgi:hypothetical protein